MVPENHPLMGSGGETMEIRLASPDDAEEILAVYAPYVRNTAVSFEVEVPDLGAFRSRMEGIMKRYPYLAAVDGRRIAGYAYAGAFGSRAAYQHSAELSIYLAGDCRGRGIGRLLYRELEACLLRQHVFSAFAGVTVTDRENDPYVTDASIRFHEKAGYVRVAEFPRCGFKFGRWYSVAWLGKELGVRPADPAPFIPFPDLPPASFPQSGNLV